MDSADDAGAAQYKSRLATTPLLILDRYHATSGVPGSDILVHVPKVSPLLVRQSQVNVSMIQSAT